MPIHLLFRCCTDRKARNGLSFLYNYISLAKTVHFVLIKLNWVTSKVQIREYQRNVETLVKFDLPDIQSKLRKALKRQLDEMIARATDRSKGIENVLNYSELIAHE